MNNTNKSFGLYSTNPLLTSNLYLTIDSDKKFYLESINSTSELEDSAYKHFKLNKDSIYSKAISSFYNGAPQDIVFYQKNNKDSNIQYTDFTYQNDDFYYSGVNDTEDKRHKEEFQYFAPLHFNPSNFPSDFFVFRIDGTGTNNVSKDNFRSEFLNNMKVVSNTSFKSNDLGEFINANFKSNVELPMYPMYIDPNPDQYCKFYGIDYHFGVYTNKSLILNDFFSKEQPFHTMDSFLTNQFKKNDLIYPFILNFKFLFDDYPVENDSIRYFNSNRYVGFYIDEKVKVKSLGVYNPPELLGFSLNHDNIFLVNGKIDDPFKEGFDRYSIVYIEYLGEYYLVTKTVYDNQVAYKIMCDVKLQGKENLINQNIISINDKKEINISIDNFETDADVYVLEINGSYHRIIKNSDDDLQLLTDYNFTNTTSFTEYLLTYTKEIGYKSFDYSKISDIVKPLNCTIYYLNFTEIKDFDQTIINTSNGNYQYENNTNVSTSDEPKLFKTDPNSTFLYKDLDEYVFKGEVVNIPTTSEYQVSCELFDVQFPNDPKLASLNTIWSKNQDYTKWSYENSLNVKESSYRFNNNSILEDYNQDVNIFETTADRNDRNLDYFYTINYDKSVQDINVAEYKTYDFQSLHIDNPNSAINRMEYQFEIDKYFNSKEYQNDYFEYFFKGKYSIINKSDNVEPNRTLFKGLKLNFVKVDNTILKDNMFNIDNFSCSITDEFKDYKFSIISAPNYIGLNDLSKSPVKSNLYWKIIKDFEYNVVYKKDDMVNYGDIIYLVKTDTVINDPNLYPNHPSYTDMIPYNKHYQDGYYKNESGIISTIPFYIDDTNDKGEKQNNINNDIVYHYGQYYFKYSTINTMFFTRGKRYKNTTNNPMKVRVIFKGRLYELTIPKLSTYLADVYPSQSLDYEYIKDVPFTGNEDLSDVEYLRIRQFDSNNNTSVVTYNNAIYYLNNKGILSDEPKESSSSWTKLYDFNDNSNTVYNRNLNPVIYFNESYYLINNNPNNETLDNGINIYINKKWKNILIQIYTNDNTYCLDNINYNYNQERDNLYTKLFNKLTAHNFINCINNLDEKYNFSNYINYYVIETDNSYKKYSLNDIVDKVTSINTLKDLPYLIYIEEPSLIQINSNSNIVETIKNKKGFSNNTLFANTNSITVESDLELLKLSTDYIGFNIKENKNLISNNHINLYRYSGGYYPMFNLIKLFKGYDSLEPYDPSIPPGYLYNLKNTKFDESNAQFGIVYEHIISKVNQSDIILRYKNKEDLISIYPMLDEFGYTSKNKFIFKSNWDLYYYTEVNKL